MVTVSDDARRLHRVLIATLCEPPRAFRNALRSSTVLAELFFYVPLFYSYLLSRVRFLSLLWLAQRTSVTCQHITVYRCTLTIQILWQLLRLILRVAEQLFLPTLCPLCKPSHIGLLMMIVDDLCRGPCIVSYQSSKLYYQYKCYNIVFKWIREQNRATRSQQSDSRAFIVCLELNAIVQSLATIINYYRIAHLEMDRWQVSIDIRYATEMRRPDGY